MGMIPVPGGAMKCSRCGFERSDFAEDLEFAVLNVEDYKRVLVSMAGRPAGYQWEIEGWKLGEAGRYRSGICAACAKDIGPALKKKRLKTAGLGAVLLLLSPVALSLWSKMPAVGLIGGVFVFPIAGLITLIAAYQTTRKGAALDVYHRRAWESAGGGRLHASYGFLPRQKGLQMRFAVPDWDKVRAEYDDERRESGWSHFIQTRHFTLSSDDHPSKKEALEMFGAVHMGEIMDRYPHTGR